MNELIENTISIISKISRSNKGYLLQLSEQGYKVLKIWGWESEDYQLFNDVLFNLLLSGEIDTGNISKLPAIESLLKKNNLSRLFMKDVVNFSERNQVIYLLLFFEQNYELNTDINDSLISVVSMLSMQIKEWFEKLENRSSQVQSDEIVQSTTEVLKDWRRSFLLLLETFPDLVFITDQSGKIILTNKAGSEVLGYQPAELKGKHLTDIIDQEDTTLTSFSFNKALTNNSPVNFKANFCSKYEELFPFEINCSPVLSNAEVLGMIGICRDLSEKNKLESELKKLKPRLVETDRLLNIERARTKPDSVIIEEMNRLKYEFISNISHEFRTTLASIVGFSETIESDPDLPEEMRKEFNRVILSEGKRLAKLINDVLESSQVEESRIVINKSRLDIVKLVQDVVEANSKFASEKNITLTYDRPAEEVIIEGDSENLFRVINALLDNAIKFTDEFGRVKLIVNNLFRDIEIVVSDTGIGIAEGDLPFIFQKFYKVSRPMSDYPSIGVGLVFVKQVVDLHKGLITVQSEIGRGTTFLVKLPKTSKIENTEVTIE